MWSRFTPFTLLQILWVVCDNPKGGGEGGIFEKKNAPSRPPSKNPPPATTPQPRHLPIVYIFRHAGRPENQLRRWESTTNGTQRGRRSAQKVAAFSVCLGDIVSPRGYGGIEKSVVSFPPKIPLQRRGRSYLWRGTQERMGPLKPPSQFERLA